MGEHGQDGLTSRAIPSGNDADYLGLLSLHVGFDEWAAFARVFMPRFVEVSGCVLWDRVDEPANFRTWQEQLKGDATSIEAIAVSWHRSLTDAFPDRTFDVAATNSEDGPIVSFVTVR